MKVRGLTIADMERVERGFTERMAKNRWDADSLRRVGRILGEDLSGLDTMRAVQDFRRGLDDGE